MFGCSQSPTPTNTIPLVTGHSQITDRIIEELKENNDWYRVINKTTVEIEYPPKQYIIDLTESEINKIVPKGRSRTFPDKLHKDVIRELSSNKINYKLVYFGNDEYIVWDEKDTNTIENIIISIATKSLNEQ